MSGSGHPVLRRCEHREGLAPPTRRPAGHDIQRAAQKKLRLLNAAGALGDLRVPPGNRLEKLTGDRASQHSIRVNDQFQICFTWTPGGPTDVEIVDYH